MASAVLGFWKAMRSTWGHGFAKPSHQRAENAREQFMRAFGPRPLVDGLLGVEFRTC